MDAKGKDAFWEKVAIVFNSNKHFDIDRQKGNKRFKTLSAAPVPYITDAAHKLAGYITFVCNSVVPTALAGAAAAHSQARYSYRSPKA